MVSVVTGLTDKAVANRKVIPGLLGVCVVSPWLWVLTGWLVAWLPAVCALGLMLIFDLLPQPNKDEYWWRQTEPIRDGVASKELHGFTTVTSVPT